MLKERPRAGLELGPRNKSVAPRRRALGGQPVEPRREVRAVRRPRVEPRARERGTIDLGERHERGRVQGAVDGRDGLREDLPRVVRGPRGLGARRRGDERREVVADAARRGG